MTYVKRERERSTAMTFIIELRCNWWQLKSDLFCIDARIQIKSRFNSIRKLCWVIVWATKAREPKWGARVTHWGVRLHADAHVIKRKKSTIIDSTNRMKKVWVFAYNSLMITLRFGPIKSINEAYVYYLWIIPFVWNNSAVQMYVNESIELWLTHSGQ